MPLIPRCKRNTSYRFESCPDYKIKKKYNMERLTILALLLAVPSIFFMIIAKVNGGTGIQKFFIQLFLKIPALLSLILIVIIGLVYLNLIKIA